MSLWDRFAISQGTLAATISHAVLESACSRNHDVAYGVD